MHADRSFLILVVGAALLLAGALHAEPLLPGDRYQGKVTLDVPELRLRFDLPAGYAGVLPPGSSWFHVGRDNEEGRVFVYADRVTRAEMKALMSKPFPAADAVMLTPKGPVRTEGRALVADYDAGEGYVGHARVLTSPSGVSVALVAVAPPARLAAFKQLLATIERSVQLDVELDVELDMPAPAGAPGSGPWARALANQRVSRFSHGSGYSEKTSFLLCADGRFFRSFGASSVSGLGSGGAQSQSRGRWTVSGDVLTLRYDDGRADSVELQDRGGQLYVDGTRWLREAAACP